MDGAFGSLSLGRKQSKKPKQWKDLTRSPPSRVADGYMIEIVLVHDLNRGGADPLDRLENLLCHQSSSASKTTGVPHRLRAYRMDMDGLRRTGDFDMEYGVFAKRFYHNLAPELSLTPKKETMPTALRPNIIFIGFELGAWLVKNLLYNKGPLPGDDQANDTGGLINHLLGAIFVGGDVKGDFNHEKYTHERLGEHLQRSRRLAKTLRTIDEHFAAARQHDAISRATYILPAPDLTSLPQFQLSDDETRRHRRSNSIITRFRARSQLSSPVNSGSDSSGEAKATNFRRNLLCSLISAAGEEPSESFKKFRYVPERDWLEDPVDDSNISDAARFPATSFDHLQLVPSNSSGLEAMVPSPTAPDTAARILLQAQRDAYGLTMVRSTSPQPLESPLLQHPRQIRIEQFLHEHGRTSPRPIQSGPSDPSGPSGLTISAPGSPSGEYFPNLPPNCRRDLAKQDSLNTSLLPSPGPGRDTMPPPKKRDTQASSPAAAFETVSRKFDRFYDPSHAHSRKEEAAFLNHCIVLLKGPGARAGLRWTLQARVAVIEFDNGKYNKARGDLDSVVKAIHHHPGLSASPELRRSRLAVLYHRSVVLVRIGEHELAWQDLILMQQDDEFRHVEDLLSSATNIVDETVVDPLFEIVIHTNRLMALLNGYYGRFDAARLYLSKAESLCHNFFEADARLKNGTAANESPTLAESTKIPSLPLNPGALRAKLELARAKLQMIQGNERLAIGAITSTLHSLETDIRFGKRHLLTLEAACLRALILARMSADDAGPTCEATWELTAKTMGDDHPLTMEALSTLTSVFVSRSRPYEALDTAFDLWTRAKAKLGKDNPQTLRYWYQVGELNLSMGNYAKARHELRGLCSTAEGKWRRSTSSSAKQTRDESSAARQQDLGQYPDVLQYQVRLAMADCCLDRLVEAERDAGRALLGQLRVFWPNGDSVWSDDDEADTATSLDQLVQNILLKLDENLDHRPHPELLETLQVCATILEKRTTELPELAQLRSRLLATIYRHRDAVLGEAHPRTLASQLELAFDELESRGDGSIFRSAASSCARALGANHILTWRAKLGLLFESSEAYKNPELFRAEAAANLSSQEILMGECHPLVLDSRWRLFVYKLLVYRDEDAHETGLQLLSLLRMREVRQERLMESLQLEEKVARIYALQQKEYEQSLAIANHMLDYCLGPINAKLDGEYRSRMDGFCERACDLLHVAAQGLLSESQAESWERFQALSEELRMEAAVIQRCRRRFEGTRVLGSVIYQALVQHGSTESLGEQMTAALARLRHRWEVDEAENAEGTRDGKAPA